MENDLTKLKAFLASLPDNSAVKKLLEGTPEFCETKAEYAFDDLVPIVECLHNANNEVLWMDSLLGMVNEQRKESEEQADYWKNQTKQQQQKTVHLKNRIRQVLAG